jgi:hypothetical protein
MERRVGDICVATSQADGRDYVVLLTDVDYSPPGKLDSFDVGCCLRGRYLGSRIRLDRIRVVLSAEELLKILAEKGFDLVSSPEPPESQLTEVEKLRRENDKIRREFEQRLAALEAKKAS